MLGGVMSRRRKSKRSRSARNRRPGMLTRLRERVQLVELEQRHLDLAGLGMVALAAFFAFVLYFGWDGGKVGSALAVALRFLLGEVAYVVPIALLASGAILV